jgi:4-alpha-glucanotransferase
MTKTWSKYFGFGILLHVTALPSQTGMGDLGPSSIKFLDWLKKIGANTWQVLPTGITDETHCPYACYSAFGGNPLLISLEKLKIRFSYSIGSEKKLEKNSSVVNFESIEKYKSFYFKQAFEIFKSQPKSKDYEEFIDTEKFWINDLAVFLVLTEKFGHDWSLWPNEYSDYNSPNVSKFIESNIHEVDYQKFLQFVFNQQWIELKLEAEKRNIQIFGDIPIFVSFHSMEVWKWPHLFKLGKNNKLEIETGAPPDAFNDQGQKWGTPNYNWSAMKDNNFSWWIERIRYQEKRFNLLRLDHFLGFINVWESPKEDIHSINGSWVKTPGDELFNILKKEFPHLPLIAEDLGETNDAVFELRDKYQFPGMKILQFAFGEDADKLHHPHNISTMNITYTGTHDNNTFCGHLSDLELKKNSFVNDLKELSNENNPAWAIIDIALRSNAILSIFPIQDLLELGEEARFNTPGTISSRNWSWCLQDLPGEFISNKVKTLAIQAGRAK